MSEKQNQMREIINQAMQLEIAGRQLYLKAQELVADPKGKAMFAQIAKDEIDHMKVLEALYQSLQKDNKWLSYEEALKYDTSAAPKVKFFIDEAEIKRRLGPTPTEFDALKVSMEGEQRAIEHYARAMALAEDPKAKDVFKFIKEMEESHYKILKWEHDALSKSGYWCDTAEFSVELPEG